MTSIEQIQKDIQTLPPEAQDLLIDFIQILKKRYPEPQTENTDLSPESRSPLTPLNKGGTGSFLEDAQEFIGCLEGGPGDLATNKKYLEGFGTE